MPSFFPVRQNQIREKIQFTGIMIIATLPSSLVIKNSSLYLAICSFFFFYLISSLRCFFFMYSSTLVKFQVRQV